ncbi:DUF2268 domain-containing putative Zn-dependent protease [Microvirga thermotolerans]|uniref:DUF2268 domain-containing protein n=1 Tax=Microvirga thermotolerans TaxID=2651334 RepID=A0A5P9JUD8_9HYPH|nr:DUF2268 domain-containing putative Zn-dependent protease [Microvirga thermotolerans]QFU15779.1 hypothetical protein GDR74_05835 [Microvirga thermotolerans]
MNWVLHFLESEGSLGPWRARLEAEARATHERIAACLAPDVEMPPLDVVIERLEGQAIPELGLAGIAPRRRCMVVTLDPANPRFEASLEAGEFGRILTHEFHHCLRCHSVGYGTTLAEALVTEGLADQFDREINGGEGQIWDHALRPEHWPALLERAEEAFRSPRYDHRLWFFGVGRGGRGGTVPRWAGYTIGYRLVGAYLETTPGARPSRMAGTPAAEVLAKAWPRLVERFGGPASRG